MKIEVLSGEKTVLIPLNKRFADYYLELLQNDTAYDIGNPLGISTTTLGWIAKTKEGKATRNIGIIMVTPQTNISVSFQMSIDPIFAENIEDEIKKRYTYVEDAMATVLEFLIGVEDIHHIGAMLLREDRVGEYLLGKMGFEKEGRLRNIIKFDDGIHDFILMGRIKSKVEIDAPVDTIPKKIEAKPIELDGIKPIDNKELVNIGIEPMKKE